MSTPSDRPWPERANTAEHPATLTVLGVDRGDGALPTELQDAVPEDADALFTDRPRDRLSRGERLRAYTLNPALGLLGITALLAIGSDYVSYGTTGREYDRRAVREIAESWGIPVEPVGRSSLAAVGSLPIPWLLAGWSVSLLLFVAAVAALLSPGFGTVLFLVVVLVLASAYVLAYLGVTIDSDRSRLFEEIRQRSEENGYEHPVAVVRRRHVPGVVDYAKEARIRTRDRTVSPASGSDWTEH